MIDHPRDWMASALCAVGGMPPEAWTEVTHNLRNGWTGRRQ